VYQPCCHALEFHRLAFSVLYAFVCLFHGVAVVWCARCSCVKAGCVLCYLLSAPTHLLWLRAAATMRVGSGVAVVDREGHYKRFLAVYWMWD
jgi:hypothetical protein